MNSIELEVKMTFSQFFIQQKFCPPQFWYVLVKMKKKTKKNIAGQVLTYNSKNFHLLKRKLDLERTMNGLGKPFRNKSNPKK